MLVGFTGINSNSVAVDTVGDNLANVNTTAFKGQRTLFETLLYQTISEGDAPDGQSGGTLPRQVGYGSTVASIQRNYEQGALDSTGFPSDLAVDGDGFFVLETAAGDQVYTRDGSFRLDASQTLVSAAGSRVQVFAADRAGNVDRSTLSDLVIPLGTASEAIATTEVVMDGRLDSGTNLASAGAVSVSQALITSGGVPASAMTGLTDLVDGDNIPLFAAGDVLRIQGSKGGITMPASTFVVGTTGSTVGDLAEHLEAVLGVVPAGDPDGAGVTVSDGGAYPAGTLVVRSNEGEINAVRLDASSITNTTGPVSSPFTFTTTTDAVGAGVTTSFNVFDSLGNPVDVRLRLSMESKSTTGTTWGFIAESTDDSDLSPVLGTGTITFDVNGQFIGATGTNLAIDREGFGSASPLALTLDFSGLTGLASPDGTSELVMASQNGAPAGILTGYSVDADGIVTGTYSNQQTRVFGQVALAMFPNEEGLVALSENTYTFGPNSGDVSIVAPQTEAAGAVRSAALEQSNVDIAREYVNLITASTGISSASRVVRVADELLEELLVLVR
jgi:flagellar hook protein FlgE